MQEHLCKNGVGLRPLHYPFLETRPKTSLKWFEAVTENFIDSYGRPLQILELMRSDYPIALHGVGMNLLSTEGLNDDYLKRLRRLIDRIDPFIVSDHLCWTGVNGRNTHDLLPYPYNSESLKIAVRNISRAQDQLERQLLIENVSSYMSFRNSIYSEQHFINQVVKRTGCKILLDINNVFVSSRNHGFDPYTYLDQLPLESIGQIHLAGHSDMGDFLFDTHSTAVCAEVWTLFSYFIAKAPHIPFMIERDDHIPDFRELEAEVGKGVLLWKTATQDHSQAHDRHLQAEAGGR